MMPFPDPMLHSRPNLVCIATRWPWSLMRHVGVRHDAEQVVPQTSNCMGGRQVIFQRISIREAK